MLGGNGTLLLVAGLYLALAIIPALMARARGDSPVAWYLISLLINPVLAAVMLMCLPQEGEAVTRIGLMRKCPACTGLVQAGINVCPHCHAELPPVASQASRLLQARPADGVSLWPAVVFAVFFISSLIAFGIYLKR